MIVVEERNRVIKREKAVQLIEKVAQEPINQTGYLTLKMDDKVYLLSYERKHILKIFKGIYKEIIKANVLTNLYIEVVEGASNEIFIHITYKKNGRMKVKIPVFHIVEKEEVDNLLRNINHIWLIPVETKIAILSFLKAKGDVDLLLVSKKEIDSFWERIDRIVESWKALFNENEFPHATA